MIQPYWRRIAGFHMEDSGQLGVVWLAHDLTASVIHCYDAALFNTEVMAVVTEGIAARGRRIPIAWRKKDKAMANKLLSAKLPVLPDPSEDSQAMAEVVSREIWQRLLTSQFKVEVSVGAWLKEYKKFYRDGEQIPQEGFPLMAATRHAIQMLPFARSESDVHRNQPNAPKVAIV